MPTNVGAAAQQLYAEIVLRDKTSEGAASARANLESIGSAAEKTNRTVERTEKINASAERAYAKLHRRLEPLVTLQEKLERDERTLSRAREQGLISVAQYERNLGQLNDQFDRSRARLETMAVKQAEAGKAANDNAAAMRNAADASAEMEDRIERQNNGLAGLANTTLNTVGSLSALATGVISLKLAQLEAVDYTSKMSIGMGLLARVLPIAGVIALTLALAKLGFEGVKAIRAIVSESVALAKVQREAEGQVAAAITSTGGSARRSIDDVRALANELQNLTNTADEVTIRAGAQLLTFTNIKGENFDRALTIGNDVAARLKRDPEQVALQLGKALNDPVRNLGALTESGIQFSDGQRNLINSLAKVNELGTAQAIILAELENQFEGAARAQRLAEGGSIALANAWGDVKEQLGDQIVERTAASTDRLARAVGDPVWKSFFGLLGGIVGGLKNFKTEIQGGLLQGAADFFRGIGIVTGAIAGFFTDLSKFDMRGVEDSILDLAAGFERLTGLDLSGFFGAISSGLAAVRGLAEDVKKLLDGIGDGISRAVELIPERFRKDGAVRDLAVGGPALGPTLALLGIGRRAREANAPAALSPDGFRADRAANIGKTSLSDVQLGLSGDFGGDVESRIAQSLPKIIQHYESLTAKAGEYYNIISTRGPEALEQFIHERELAQRIKEAREGLPQIAADAIEAQLREADAYDRQTEALKKGNAELDKRQAILSGLSGDNDNLRAQIDAAKISREELEIVQRRQTIETKIASIKDGVKGLDEKRLRGLLAENDALAAQLELEQRSAVARLDAEETQSLIDAAAISADELYRAERRLDVEREIAELRARAARAEVDFDETAERNAIDERDARQSRLDELSDAAVTLERDLNSVADNFVDRLVREGRLGFKEMGRDLKNILLDSVLDPFRNGLRGALNGLFSGGAGFNFGSIFSPGINGANPAGGGFGGFGGLAQFGAGGGLGSLAAGIGGLSLGGASSAFGALSLIGPANLGVGGAAIGNFLGLAGGVTDKFAGALAGAGTFGGALGGIGGSLLSGAVFGQSKAQSIGSTVGGIAGNLIPIPVLGPLIGSFLGGAIGSLFAGKPSNNVGQTVFDPLTGAINGTGQDKGGEQNLEIAKRIAGGVSDTVARVADLIGADLNKFLNAEVGDRNGINIGFQGPQGQILNAQRFDNTEAGYEAAIKAGIKLSLANLTGGDETLTAAVRQLALIDEPIETIINRVQNLAAALNESDEPVDAFKQRLDTLVDAFDGLDRSSGALKAAFDKAITSLSASANEDNQKTLDAIINPLKAQLAEQTKALAARRTALEEINAKGGNVDLSLFDQLSRRQVLGQFNLEQRLSVGADPARASVDAFRENQRLELDALTSVVGRFGVTLEDVAALQRAQAFERRAFFNTIPEEDRLRLAGEGDEFLNLSDRYGLAVDRLLEQSERLVDGFEDRARELADLESRERTGALDYERAIRDLDANFGQGNPAQRLDIARANVDDLRSRALVSEDSEDRQFARDQLPQAVQDLAAAGQRAGASSPLAQEAFAYGRSVLVEVKAARENDADTASRSLAALEESRTLLEDIRDILASPELDARALADKALALPEGFGERELVISLARDLLEIQQAQFEQNDRITAALEALTPEDIGLSAPGSSAANDNPAPDAPSAFTGADANQSAPPQTATAGGGSTTTTQNADIVTGLYQIAKRLDASNEQDKTYYDRQLRAGARSDAKLAAIAAK